MNRDHYERIGIGHPLSKLVKKKKAEISLIGGELIWAILDDCLSLVERIIDYCVMS